MEFLKTVLSEELYNQLTVALNTYNGKPENKEKQIKLANLASGQYVDKGKYDTLTAEKTNLEGQITTLNNSFSFCRAYNCPLCNKPSPSSRLYICKKQMRFTTIWHRKCHCEVNCFSSINCHRATC